MGIRWVQDEQFTTHRRWVQDGFKWCRKGGNGFQKIVPMDFHDLLVDPIALAVWYLDDGSTKE